MNSGKDEKQWAYDRPLRNTRADRLIIRKYPIHTYPLFIGQARESLILHHVVVKYMALHIICVFKAASKVQNISFQ